VAAGASHLQQELEDLEVKSEIVKLNALKSLCVEHQLAVARETEICDA